MNTDIIIVVDWAGKMDFTALDEAIRLKQQQKQDQEQQQQQQQQDEARPGSSIELFKIIRNKQRQWDDRMRRKFAQSTLNQIAAERKIKYISTMRSNPYIDRTVIFNQFTSNVIQAASATILDTAANDYEEITARQQPNNPYNRTNMNGVRFNLNRNEMNLLNQQQQKEQQNIDSSIFRVGSSSLNNKFDIVIPTGVVLPPIKGNYDQYQSQPENDTVFDRLNPKYAVIKRNRNLLSKVAYMSLFLAKRIFFPVHFILTLFSFNFTWIIFFVFVV